MSPEILRISCSFDKRPNNGSRSVLTSFRSCKLCLLLPLGANMCGAPSGLEDIGRAVERGTTETGRGRTGAGRERG